MLQKISLLGPLEIVCDGQAAGIMQSRQGCALLSHLLVTRQSLSRESIAALLWDGPSTADTLRYLRKLLYRLSPLLPDLHVSRHRIAFQPDERIAVDLYILEAALAGNDIEALDQALGLYRGDLLAGFYLAKATGFNEWLVVERERLRQQVNAGFHRVCDSHMAQASWPAGIAAARRWLATDPLDEQVQRRLMEFLAADGQITAAISQYESLRRLLWTELSVEPELATTQLVQRLEELQAGKGIQLRPPPVDEPAYELPEPGILPEPGMLPARSWLPHHRNAVFIGRAAELLWLYDQLLPDRAGPRRPVQAAAVTGMGGLGKTQLAVEYAYRFGRYYPGGVYWISFADADTVPEGIAAVGGERGMRLYRAGDTLTLAERVARVQANWQEVAARLLIFDNCNDEQLVADWLPVSGGCSVLVTSRRSEWALGLPLSTLALTPLPRAESVAFLNRIIGCVTAEDADLIAQEVGDLPLALHLAGQFLAQHQHTSPRDYIVQLKAGRSLQHVSFRATAVRYSPTHHEMDIERTFMLSFRQLRQDDETDALALNLLANAACFVPAEPIPLSLLLASVHVDGAEAMDLLVAENALTRLVNLGLIQRGGSETIAVHRLIVAFTRESWGETEEMLALAEAAVVQAIVQAVAPDLARFPYHITLPCSVAHVRHIFASVRESNKNLSILLAAALGQHLDMVAEYGEARHQLELAVKSADAGADAEARGITHFLLARTLVNLGHDADALTHLEQAVTSMRRAKEGRNTFLPIFLSEMGWVLSRLGYLRAAIKAADESYALSQQSNDAAAAIAALNRLGVLHYYMMDMYARGAVYLERALAVFDEHEVHQAKTHILTNLGENKRMQRYFDEAIALHEAALRESRLAGNRNIEFVHMNNLYGTQAEAGMYREALAGLEELVEQAPPDWRGLSETYRNLAAAYLGLRQLRPALETAQLSLAHAELTHNPRDLACAWRVLGRVAARSGRHVRKGQENETLVSARDCFAKSLDLFSGLRLRRDCAITLWYWAEHELAEGEAAKSAVMAEEARQIFTALELPLWLAQTGASLAPYSGSARQQA